MKIVEVTEDELKVKQISFVEKMKIFFVEISKSNLKELFARNFYSLEIILCAHSVFF